MGKTPNARRIELNGEYDVSQKEAIAALFAALPPDGPAVIDLSKCTYVDSTFLSELVKLRQRFKEHPITLLGASGSVMRVLRLVHFNRLFEIPE
ncbi:MAG: STAS domain-containing protein [Candidatus Cybelea sp.]|jgi:anti-anti-sigma factor